MKYIELNHQIEGDMTTYPGLPKPLISVFMDFDESRSHYDGRAEFRIGRLDMVGSTGTYLDAPLHRHRDGLDVSRLPLEKVAGLPGVSVRGLIKPDGSVDLPRVELGGRAVLVYTGWDSRWKTEAYWESPPHLSAEAVSRLVEEKAALVGVDWGNVDDTKDPARPAHTKLLREGVLIVENMRNLRSLPAKGFRFYAVPLRVAGGASQTVRAFAEVG